MQSHTEDRAETGQPPPVSKTSGGYDQHHYFHAFLDRSGSKPVLLIDHPDGAVEVEGLDQMRALRTTIDRAIRLAKVAARSPKTLWGRPFR